MRELRVRGKATMSLPPDTVEIMIQIQAFHPDYERMIADFEVRMNHLINDMFMIGIDKEELRTTDYTIETKYNYRNNERVFAGYEVRQSMRLRLPFERDVLNQVMRTLSTSQAKPNLELAFTVAEVKKHQLKLLEKAIQDGYEKAVVMANAANVRLGDVKSLEEQVASPLVNQRIAHTYALEDAAMAILPADVVLTQEVDAIYFIESLK